METEALVLDPQQRAAATTLDGLLDRRGRPRRGHRGIYLHGRPGRGKTMVMDRFFAAVTGAHKRRFHFHAFFARLHQAVHVHHGIDGAIDELLGDARLVCFDEFHVHDIGDATLIARMLDALFARKLVLVVTSNYPPAGLLPNPLFHDSFLPTIAELEAHLEVVSVDGPVDYRTLGTRRGHGFTAGTYRVTAGTPVARPMPIELGGGRTVQAENITGDTVTFQFTALCGTPTSAADYLGLAGRFRRWTLRGVPLLREVPPDHAMRLVNLVDVLYDADLPLTVEAAGPVDALIAEVRGVPDLTRTASRLGELPAFTQVAAATG